MSKETILKNLQHNIAMENFKDINRRQNKAKKILQNTLTVTLCTLSLTGIVFAKDISTKIYDNFFLMGKGIDIATNEGYIENTNMDYELSNTSIENIETGQKIADVDTKIKVDEFVMDDFNLSMTFNVELSEQVRNIIKTEEIREINFPDLIISDENNIVLFCTSGNQYDEFSKENNLEYEWEEALNNGKVIGSGVNIVPIVREGNQVKIVYNIYTGGNSSYPKSKKLKVKMNQIKISKKERSSGNEEITLTGDWDFEIDVPEKMYNRTTEIYTQKNTTNDDYKVTTAALYDTGMKISLEVQSEKPLERPTSQEWEFYRTLDEGDEIKTSAICQYISIKEEQTEEYKKWKEQHKRLTNISVYLTNANGEKFEETQSASENGAANIDENGVLKYEAMFDLTKYNQTDSITIHIDYNGAQEEIVLGKEGVE